MCGIGERRSEEMPKKAANIKLMKILLLALGVLIAALVVMLILLLAQGGANNEKQDAFVEESTYLNGISIAGIDISGQTYVQAAANAELQELARQVEDVFSYSLTVNGRGVYVQRGGAWHYFQSGTIVEGSDAVWAVR